MTGIHWLCRGKSGGKLNFSLRLQYEQRRLFSLVLQTFWVLFWAVRTAMKVPGKVFKVGGKVIKLEGKVLFPLPWRLFQAPSGWVLKRFVGQEKIAFFSQVILDKQNCILPPFPPAKSVYSGSLMASRISRFARYSNWSHSWPENTDFLGEKRGKNAILLISYNFPKENSYCYPLIALEQKNQKLTTEYDFLHKI